MRNNCTPLTVYKGFKLTESIIKDKQMRILATLKKIKENLDFPKTAL